MASGTQTKAVQLVSGIPTMTAISYRHEQSSGATSWVVSHNLGQKYCNVEVIDGGDDQIVPQGINFDSSTQLTVTFSQNQTGVVIVNI